MCLGISVVVGCSDAEPELPPPAPVAAPALAPASTAAAAAATPAADQPPAQAPSDVEPELKPIQMAIQSFETQNKRMPMNVDELVASGALQSLPKPPPGKMYYIDHATKRIRLGGSE